MYYNKKFHSKNDPFQMSYSRLHLLVIDKVDSYMLMLFWPKESLTPFCSLGLDIDVILWNSTSRRYVNIHCYTIFVCNAPASFRSQRQNGQIWELFTDVVVRLDFHERMFRFLTVLGFVFIFVFSPMCIDFFFYRISLYSMMSTHCTR